MVYKLVYYVDGGCRGNGTPNAIGAAAVVKHAFRDQYLTWTRRLTAADGCYPTNQRAELTAVILALELALERHKQLELCPRLDLTIKSDSDYAVNCMNIWRYNWYQNGWLNSRGNPVANRDLIEQATALDNKVVELGERSYVWISREKNSLADKACNEVMNEMENELY